MSVLGVSILPVLNINLLKPLLSLSYVFISDTKEENEMTSIAVSILILFNQF